MNITQPFQPAHHPVYQAFGVQSVPPPPEPDGHLYCVVERLKLDGFINAQIACTLLYATLYNAHLVEVPPAHQALAFHKLFVLVHQATQLIFV